MEGQDSRPAVYDEEERTVGCGEKRGNVESIGGVDANAALDAVAVEVTVASVLTAVAIGP